MLYVVAGVLSIAWLLGFGVLHVTSAFIHLVLVLAVIAAVVELFRGRSAV
jgi:hypothetical protein